MYAMWHLVWQTFRLSASMMISKLSNLISLWLTDAVFSWERFTMVTAHQGFVTKSQLLEKPFTWN